jgi:hypothetical protein
MSTKVLVSRGFGAGWSTWSYDSALALAMATDEGLVRLVEQGVDKQVLNHYADTVWPEQYNGGVADLEVVEVATGKLWRLSEYDGSESLEVLDTSEGWNRG